MKKYTIKDNLGNKKTIFAKDLVHALKIADSSLNDSTYELYLGNNFSSDDWVQIRNTIKRYGLYVGEYRKGMKTITVHGDRKNIEKLLEYFGHHKGYSKEYNNIKDSVKDDLDNDIYKALVEVSKNKNTHSSFGWNGIIEGMVENILISKGIIKKEDRFKVRKQVQQQMKESRVQKLFKDSINDEANLPTTIQALVNDEEAAIKAYEVAIKNLEGKIDETQMQVLINIMKDERRHVENLYAILNGQVTEKNLEDSIHDGVNEARELVERAGFKVKRAYGSDNEPYITVDWNGSYSELRKKVSALKSEAKKIGYKDVYADGNDICFSKW